MARQQLADGAHAYNTARHERANTILTQFIKEHGEAPEAGEAHYIRGLALLKLNRRTEARRDLQMAAEKSPRRDVRVRALAALGVMAYDDDDWATAVKYYKDAIPWASDLQEYDDHLLRYGICLQRLGNWEESAYEFARVVDGYPKGSAAKTARIMLGWNHPYFTVQCHALTNADAADKEVSRLRAAGLDATKELDTRDKRALYLVQVGKYRTYDEAQQALVRVKRIGNVPNARIVP